jgi:hypothetical protein
LHFGQPLNTRQQSLLDSLPEYDSRVIVSRNSVKMSDLSALTANTGVEYAMFTKGNERLIVRGDERKVNVGVEEAALLNEQGYRLSGHTHVGTGLNMLLASDSDKIILREFKQEESAIYDSAGKYATFGKF